MSKPGMLLDMVFKSAGIVAVDDKQLSAQQQQRLQRKQLPYALSAKGELLFVKDRKWTPYEYEENYQLYLQKLAEHLAAQAQEKAAVSPARLLDQCCDRGSDGRFGITRIVTKR